MSTSILSRIAAQRDSDARRRVIKSLHTSLNLPRDYGIVSKSRDKTAAWISDDERRDALHILKREGVIAGPEKDDLIAAMCARLMKLSDIRDRRVCPQIAETGRKHALARTLGVQTLTDSTKQYLLDHPETDTMYNSKIAAVISVSTDTVSKARRQLVAEGKLIQGALPFTPFRRALRSQGKDA